jgi:hypothetical protein
MRIYAILFMVHLLIECSGQGTSTKVICTEYQKYVLTHELVPSGPIPTVFDPNGVYPYISYSETANRPVPVKYRFITLENEQIKVTICPDLGGKVTSMILKASGKDTQFNFPEGKVLSHSSVIDTIDWKSQGPVCQRDIKEMTGYFWETHNVNAFGVYTPSFGSGLYHVADEAIAPGIKLWSYGDDSDSTWATLSTARNAPYVEIQGGPLGDQSIKLELKSNETRWHTEYWIPADKPMDINILKVPSVKLRDLKMIPLFEWARSVEVRIWIELMGAYKENGNVPDSPEITDIHWAPSGMEDLQQAFEWVIKKSETDKSDTWNFFYGTWTAGRGDTAKAIKILGSCKNGIAKALLARLLRLNGNNKGSALAYSSIEERWLQLHPQVLIERDKTLRNLGKEKLKEREAWLSQVDALRDEWVIERKVQLLIDKGDAPGAKKMLLSVPFQKVHQTYTRTNLWFQICDLLNEQRLPVPAQLGEDRLANFGAYREYE